MAVFNDYLDLRFAVGEHVGNRSISDVVPRLVQQAESLLNRQLRTRNQITDATLTFVDGVAPLPADFLEILDVSGRYTVKGPHILIQGFSGDRAIRYYAKLPTLTTSASTSNWLLEQYPDAYLYSVGMEAAKFLRDADLVAATTPLLAQALSSVKVDDDRARWATATVQVQGCTP